MTTRQLALLVVLVLLTSLMTAACAGSSKQTTEETAASSQKDTSQSAEMVDCNKLQEKAKSADGATKAGDLPLRAVGPVATIDGDDIPASEFNSFARKKISEQRKLPEPLAERLKHQTARQIVERRLIEQTLTDSSVEVKRHALEARYADFQRRFDNHKHFQRFLDQRQMTPTELRAELCRDLQLKNYLTEHYGESIDEEEIADYYKENKSEFETPAQAKASHILVSVPEDASRQEIQKARRRAERLSRVAKRKETDFAELARQSSDGPSAKKGGLLGYFSRTRMVPKFSDKAFAMKPGEISGPVRTEFGFHVIKLHDKRPAESQSLEEVKSQIRRKLQRKTRRASLQSFLEETKGDRAIEYHLENIEARTGSAHSKKSNEAESLPEPPGGPQ